MSKPRIIVLIANLVLTVLVPVVFGAHSLTDFLAGFAILSFFVALLDVIFGVLVVAVSKSKTPAREVGTTMLLVGAVLLLTSLTLCSSGSIKI